MTRRQLRRHRRRDRTRTDARLRRSGPPVRCERQSARLVDAGRPQGFRRAHPVRRRRVLRLRAATGNAYQRQAHSGRKRSRQRRRAARLMALLDALGNRNVGPGTASLRNSASSWALARSGAKTRPNNPCACAIRPIPTRRDTSVQTAWCRTCPNFRRPSAARLARPWSGKTPAGSGEPGIVTRTLGALWVPRGVIPPRSWLWQIEKTLAHCHPERSEGSRFSFQPGLPGTKRFAAEPVSPFPKYSYCYSIGRLLSSAAIHMGIQEEGTGGECGGSN